MYMYVCDPALISLSTAWLVSVILQHFHLRFTAALLMEELDHHPQNIPSTARFCWDISCHLGETHNSLF